MLHTARVELIHVDSVIPKFALDVPLDMSGLGFDTSASPGTLHNFARQYGPWPLPSMYAKMLSGVSTEQMARCVWRDWEGLKEDVFWRRRQDGA